jgi:hypothetical protein
MRRLLCSIAFLWVFLLFIPIAGAAPQRIRPPTDAELERQTDDANRRQNERASMDTLKRNHDHDEAAGIEEERFYNRKMTDAQKKLITPAADDEAAYRDFLRQDHTGLIRLLPAGKYDLHSTVAAADPDRVLPIRGGGAFYSFVEKSQSLGPWSEITLQEGTIIAGFWEQSLGPMTRLGDVPIESVTLTTPGVEYLNKMVPPTGIEELSGQRTINFQGFKVGARAYNSRQRVIANQTYALRSVVYKQEGHMKVLPGGGAVFIHSPSEYKGADELIVFRVLHADADGGVTILWKRLQKFSSTKIKAK